MFAKNSPTVQALRNRRAAAAKPEAGAILTGLKMLPVRIHCQLKHGSDDEIFAYATMVALMSELDVADQTWFLRDFASTELAGTKMILSNKSRDALLDKFADHPILADVDVLPVASIKVLKAAASGKSFEVEIHEYLSPEQLELCAEYAKIAIQGDAEETEKARQDFYAAQA